MQIESPKTQSLVRLDRIADDINSKFGEAVRFAGESSRNGKAAIVAAIECGKLLIQAKRSIGHGGWEKWLLDNCNEIHANTARKWMLLAKSLHGVDLTNCEGLRQAYIAIGILPEPETKAKALGMSDLDIQQSLVVKFIRECDRIETLVDGYDLSAMPAERKEEVRAAINKVKEIEGRL